MQLHMRSVSDNDYILNESNGNCAENRESEQPFRQPCSSSATGARGDARDMEARSENQLLVHKVFFKQFSPLTQIHSFASFSNVLIIHMYFLGDTVIGYG